MLRLPMSPVLVAAVSWVCAYAWDTAVVFLRRTRTPCCAEPARLVLPCTIVEVYDGDTITVRLTLDLRVRMLDCWTPEIRTRDASEKARGIAARDALSAMAPAGSAATLTVPLDGADRLDDVITLGRVLGHVTVDGDSMTLSDRMVKARHATPTKQ